MSGELVEFFLDPMCPWAYQTSKWIRELQERGVVEVAWRFFSLEEINHVDGSKHPWERAWTYGWSQMRVAALIRRESQVAAGRWYAAVGEAFHERGEKTHDPEVHRELVAAIGFPGAVDAALADPTTAEEVRADHDEAVALHAAFGVPTIVLAGGHAVFGPVITPAPTGDEALRLWHLVSGWRQLPHLYELRHPKTPTDIVHIADSFRPYLEARDWATVENRAP